LILLNKRRAKEGDREMERMKKVWKGIEKRW